MSEPAPEITTVADDEVVVHLPGGDGSPARILGRDGLAPDTELDLGGLFGPMLAGLRARTLPRPPGQLLAAVATVNDLHFGETECGRVEGSDSPVLTVSPGEAPYPETMNRAAASEISPLSFQAVVAKGDLTDAGRPGELAAFRSCYQERFGSRLHWFLGNHDVSGPHPPRGPGVQEVRVPGLVLALLDTTIAGSPSGQVSADQLGWLDELAARADCPVLVLGHHHPWSPEYRTRPEGYFGINPSDSEALVEVVARRPAVIGYAAGHTHRNRVRRFAATGCVPWIEVAAVKDYPGTWAEYRVFEGGVLQVHRRISTPPALAWSERCRAMVDGWYPTYALGSLSDRCLALWPRS